MKLGSLLIKILKKYVKELCVYGLTTNDFQHFFLMLRLYWWSANRHLFIDMMLVYVHYYAVRCIPLISDCLSRDANFTQILQKSNICDVSSVCSSKYIIQLSHRIYTKTIYVHHYFN